jgi:hypothetical protein
LKLKLDEIKMTLRSSAGQTFNVYIDVEDNSLSRKWLSALNHLLLQNFHLEKNYCWMGFVESDRTVHYICNQINFSVMAINAANIGYKITEQFNPDNVIQTNLDINHSKTNRLHRYFEDLQGHAGNMSHFWERADTPTRWHIRQLNLLCHELESLVLSLRKAIQAPEWRRPSQLMCWLNAPRFQLDTQDYELFGIDTLNRDTGGVYVGVNKAVGKHHWEVFNDEGRDSRVGELTTSALRAQTQAAGDFDIEWAQNPRAYQWQVIKMREFREWLIANGFDPEDKSLTIGHPKVAQVDLSRTFGTSDPQDIWKKMSPYLDVYKIKTGSAEATYDYRWSDINYAQTQVNQMR